jgi:hypothetical protein
MFDKNTGTPLDLEKLLGPDPEMKATVSENNTYSISLDIVNGGCIINYKASTVGEYDWVGLYGGPNYYYEDYIVSQWAENNTSFNTYIEPQSGYQARYFVWVSDCNTCGGEYVTVAVSNTLP